MTTDVGAACTCGHPEHLGRCSCGCRRYVAAGSHADQSRGGRLPAVLAVLVFVALVLGTAVVIGVRALW